MSVACTGDTRHATQWRWVFQCHRCRHRVSVWSVRPRNDHPPTMPNGWRVFGDDEYFCGDCTADDAVPS